MPDIKYGGIYTEASTAQITTLGTTANDAWVIAAQLPSVQLPQGAAKRLGLVVKGTMQNIRYAGTVPPQRGLAQVCLGTASGTRSTVHYQGIPLRRESDSNPDGFNRGVPFCFLMVQQGLPLITDPTFGATTNTLTTTVCLWARSFQGADSGPYTARFEIADVQWLWIDMDAADADVLAEVYAPASPLTMVNGDNNIFLFQNNPALSPTGGKLLHFGCISYEPRGGPGQTTPAPRFEWGYSTTAGSFTGWQREFPSSVLRWGLQKGTLTPPLSGLPINVSQGCMWYKEWASGVYLPACKGNDAIGGVGANTLVRRAAILVLRVDSLLDQFTRVDSVAVNASTPLNSGTWPFPSVYVPLERPAAAITTGPVAFVHGVVNSVGFEHANAWTSTDASPATASIQGFLGVDSVIREGCSSMQWSVVPFTPTSPDVQVRAHFIGATSNSNQLRNVSDVLILTAFLIKDPSNLPQPPDTDPAPTWIAWQGYESPSIVGLNVVPFAPEGVLQQGYVRPEQARIDGATGYSRTWPLFAKPRRTFTFQWTLTKAVDLQTLTTFLHNNNCFKVQDPLAPTGTLMVVTQVQPYEVPWAGRQALSQVIVQVAELIWTQP